MVNRSPFPGASGNAHRIAFTCAGRSLNALPFSKRQSGTGALRRFCRLDCRVACPVCDWRVNAVPDSIWRRRPTNTRGHRKHIPSRLGSMHPDDPDNFCYWEPLTRLKPAGCRHRSERAHESSVRMFRFRAATPYFEPGHCKAHCAASNVALRALRYPSWSRKPVDARRPDEGGYSVNARHVQRRSRPTNCHDLIGRGWSDRGNGQLSRSLELMRDARRKLYRYE